MNLTDAVDVDHAEPSERALHTFSEDMEPELDAEVIEALAAQEDTDALIVRGFEHELEEFLQETPEMHDAMTTYIEARTRLLEKRRSRGFWPTKGRGKSVKGKGKGKKTRDREQLLARIARSHCRRCGALGHWKAGCPLANQGKQDLNASADDDEVYSEVEDEPECQARKHDMSPRVRCVETRYMAMSQVGESDRTRLQVRMSKFLPRHCPVRSKEPGVNAVAISKWGINKKGISLPKISLPKRHPSFVHENLSVSESRPVIATMTRKTPELLMQSAVTSAIGLGLDEEPVLLSATEQSSSFAILDTGASRCIIGEKTLQVLTATLPEDIGSKLETSPSKIKFRFANNESLTSTHRIHFPLKATDRRIVWIAVEVVPGGTPFLFSKRAFKMLGGTLDTTQDVCHMHPLHTELIPLNISHTGLYLINIGD